MYNEEDHPYILLITARDVETKKLNDWMDEEERKLSVLISDRMMLSAVYQLSHMKKEFFRREHYIYNMTMEDVENTYHTKLLDIGDA